LVKITIWWLLLTGGTAFADSTLQLERLEPAEPAPDLADSASKCASSEHTRWAEAKLDARRVVVLHECRGSESHTVLAFDAKDGPRMHLYTSAVIGDLRWPTELLSIGTLKGGKKTLLHRIDTPDADQTDSQIDVCTFDSDGAPVCGSVEITCPETGCKPPEIIKGALWLHAQDGRKRYTISLPAK
jgi:hypothetical protein